MTSNRTPNKVEFVWVENNAEPEASVQYFECDCGEVVVNVPNSTFVTTHGCRNAELEYIECLDCGTKWDAVWTGMEFEVRNE